MRRHLKLVVALPIAAALITAVFAWVFLPNQYTAISTLYVISAESTNTNTNNASTTLYSDLTASQLLANDVANLIESTRVSREAAEAVGLSDLSAYRISVSSETTTRVITLSVTGKNAADAANVANAITQATDTAARDSMGVESVNVIDVATAPDHASGPNRTLYTLVALLAGLFVAIAIVVVLDMIYPIVRSTEEAAELLDVGVIGRIPNVKRKDEVFDDAQARTAAKTLLANIRFAADDAPVKAIVVTSSIPNEGKTTTSVRLARAIAASGKTCLLVEADFRHRSVGNALNLHPKVGQYAVLSKTASLAQALVATPTQGLYFLDVEPDVPNPEDVMSTARYENMVKVLREKFDYVVFDTPPVAGFVEAALLSKITDGVVLVARNGDLPRRALRDARDQLERAGAKVLGVVGTYVEGADGGAYYGYGYGSYYNRYYKNYYGDSANSSRSTAARGSAGAAGRAGTSAHSSSGVRPATRPSAGSH